MVLVSCFFCLSFVLFLFIYFLFPLWTPRPLVPFYFSHIKGLFVSYVCVCVNKTKQKINEKVVAFCVSAFFRMVELS